jgi:hypothetical protein
MAVNEILRVHIFHNFCPIWTEFNIGDAHKSLASDCKFCKNWLSENHIQIWEINEFLSRFSTFIVHSGKNWNAVEHLQVLSRKNVSRLTE